MRGYILLFLIALTEFKVFFGDNPVWNLVSPTAFLLGIMYFGTVYRNRMLYFRIPVIYNRTQWFIVMMYSLLWLTSIIRTNGFLFGFMSIVSTTLEGLMMMWFLHTFVGYHFRNALNFEQNATDLLRWQMIGLGIFFALNLGSLILFPSVSAEADYEPGILSTVLGIDLPKTYFPYTGEGHPNNVGIIAGNFFAVCCAALLYTKNLLLPKSALIGLIFLCLVIMIIGDSRGTVLNAFLTVSLFWGLRRIRRMSLVLTIVILIPFAQLGMLAFLKAIAHTEIGKEMSRGEDANGTSDLESGNSRGTIYEYSFAELEDFKLQHLIGYGEYGPYAVGFVHEYIDKFGKNLKEEEILISSISHNGALQAIFDIGYMGAFFFIAMLFICVRTGLRLYQCGFKPGIVLSHFFLYFTLAGITESVYGRYNSSYNVVLYFFVFTTLMTWSAFKAHMIARDHVLHDAGEEGQQEPATVPFHP
jgi:hypothetical protein